MIHFNKEQRKKMQYVSTNAKEVPSCWHVQICSALQFVQIWIFVNCLMPINVMVKPAVRGGQLAIVREIRCFVKTLPECIFIWKLHAMHSAVVSEVKYLTSHYQVLFCFHLSFFLSLSVPPPCNS